jgi:hypothetical protein
MVDTRRSALDPMVAGMMTEGMPELMQKLILDTRTQTPNQRPQPKMQTSLGQFALDSMNRSTGFERGLSRIAGVLTKDRVKPFQTAPQQVATRVAEAGGLLTPEGGFNRKALDIYAAGGQGISQDLQTNALRIRSTLALAEQQQQTLIQELQRQIGTDAPQYLDLVNQIRAGNLKTVASIREAVKATPLQTKNTLLEYVQQNYSDQLENTNVQQLIKLIESRNITRFTQLSDAAQKLNIPDKYQIQQNNLLKKRVEERHTDKNGALTETGRTLMESIDAQDVKTSTALFNLEQKLGFEKLSDKEANLIRGLLTQASTEADNGKITFEQKFALENQIKSGTITSSSGLRSAIKDMQKPDYKPPKNLTQQTIDTYNAIWDNEDILKNLEGGQREIGIDSGELTYKGSEIDKLFDEAKRLGIGNNNREKSIIYSEAEKLKANPERFNVPDEVLEDEAKLLVFALKRYVQSRQNNTQQGSGNTQQGSGNTVDPFSGVGT